MWSVYIFEILILAGGEGDVESCDVKESEAGVAVFCFSTALVLLRFGSGRGGEERKVAFVQCMEITSS